MTRAQHALYRRRHLLWIAAALLFLGGAVAVAYLQIDRVEQEGNRRADQLTAEADLRGNAVSTLATDVRQLRAQLQAEGKTPIAPDPAAAVADLPERAEVPVPIPGPPGQPGRDGKPGTAGKDGRPGDAGTPGADGAAGAGGATGPQGPQGPVGPTGATGPQGERGETGPQGPAGQSCPEGYSWQAPADDPDALVCRRDGAPPPPSKNPGLLSSAALDPQRRQYP